MAPITHERPDEKIICELDGQPCHSIQLHLKNFHPEVSLEDYRRRYPDAPLISPFGLKAIAAKKAALAETTAKAVVEQEAAPSPVATAPAGKKAMHDVFGFGNAKAARGAGGNAILIDCFDPPSDDLAAMTALVDPSYVFDITLTKKIVIGFALDHNVYLWGFHGSGKTTALEQVCARTNRLWQRVQHTADMESSHVVGMMVVKNGETVWQDGPLPIAMKIGAVYCADEYDVAQPGVVAVYQPVMEGKPLIIKEAPPEFRVVKPHPNFRFVATGNTNGCGDETGLYLGTQIQNAANYSRFGITRRVEYMNEKLEVGVISAQARVALEHATLFVKYAVEVRKAYEAKTIGCIVSTRELITAAELGLVQGFAWKDGLKDAFINRQSSIDQQVLEQFAQRVFG